MIRFWKCYEETSSSTVFYIHNFIFMGAVVLNCFTFLQKQNLKLSNITSRFFYILCVFIKSCITFEHYYK